MDRGKAVNNFENFKNVKTGKTTATTRTETGKATIAATVNIKTKIMEIVL
ncbi:MAG: hypothetical protein F6K41_40630 [Symploca sp. SIO3E6]|nr:hypothetical protein [Caldora sp. SIO3E6]